MTPIRNGSDSDAPLDLKGAALRTTLRRVTIAWMFGSVWQSASTGAPLTIFATHLGANNFEFGLLAAIPFLAALLAVPASLLIDRSGQRDALFFIGQYPNRLLWIPAAFVPIWIVRHFGTDHSPIAVFIFLSLVFLINAGNGLGNPAWVHWMSDVVPARVRGRYFARRRQFAVLTGIPASLLVGWLLDRYAGASPMTLLLICGAIFSAAAVFGTVDTATFHFIPHTRRRTPRIGVIGSLLKPLRNRRFVLFSLGSGVLWFAVAGQGQFVNKFLVDRLKIHSVAVQMIVLVGPMLAQLATLSVWGRTIDRFGKKPAMVIAILGLVPIGFGWVFLHGGNIWLAYLLTAAGATCWTGVEVANFNLTIELSGTDKSGKGGGSAYVAINSVIVNIAGCLGGLFFGSVAEAWTGLHWNSHIAGVGVVTYYEALFAISAALRLVAVVPVLLMREPEAQPTIEALRFIAGNLYSNAAGAVLMPARLFRTKDMQE